MASGPSLTQDDVDFVRDKARVVVINTTYQMAPWADCLYACDARWWKWFDGAKDFTGLKYALDPPAQAFGVSVLKNTGTTGLETQPNGLRNGRNSGYQAMNLAVHFGAQKIVLLGYDMKRGTDGRVHWHGDHRQAPNVPFALFVPAFETLVKPLRELGISVVNCSRSSALTCFPKAPLRETLRGRESHASAAVEATL